MTEALDVSLGNADWQAGHEQLSVPFYFSCYKIEITLFPPKTAHRDGIRVQLSGNRFYTVKYFVTLQNAYQQKYLF